MSQSEVLKHISTIASELKSTIPSDEMNQFIIPDADAGSTPKRDRIEARILKLASIVANESHAAIIYSNFHTWEAFHTITDEKAARTLAPGLTSSMHPFCNCLTISSSCADRLRAVLEAEGPEYTAYADRVQLVTNNWQQYAISSRLYHCVTILRLVTHCIVIDAVSCASAFKVDVCGLHKPAECASEGFVYVASGGARLLVEYKPKEPCYSLDRPKSRRMFKYNDPYTEIKDGLAGGVQNLLFPSEDWHMRGRLPSRRKILVNQVWKRKPADEGVSGYEKLSTGDRFVVETCFVRVNFAKRKITVKLIPYTEWLNRAENSKWLRRLQGRKEFTLYDHGQQFGKFKISLADQRTGAVDKDTTHSLKLMDALCMELGMPEHEILRMVIIVLNVLKEHDDSEGKQSGQGRKKVDGLANREANDATCKSRKVKGARSTRKRRVPH